MVRIQKSIGESEIMINEKKILAIIPARGGSKGLPGKNIKEMLGKPLIAWTIEQGLNSKYIDKLIVSTDDQNIAEISKKYGAVVPFIRPFGLAKDDTKTIDVIFHALDFFERENSIFDILILLEPTSPLRESKDIDNALEKLFYTSKAESIVGVSKVEGAHPDFLVKLESGFLRPYKNKDFNVMRRQDIEDLFFYEGSLYISYITSLKKRKNFYHEKTLGYIMPKWKSYEVDDLSDFIIIEALLRAHKEGLL